MADGGMANLQPDAGPKRDATMSRAIAHAITAVLAAFVAAFALLFLLARAQEDTATDSHPLDFLMTFYGATGIVETFAATAIVWIAIFVGLTELLVATRPNRARALRSAIIIQLACFAGFIAVWYLPL